MKGENFADHIFVKCPPPPTKKGHLTGGEDFNIEHCLEYLEGRA